MTSIGSLLDGARKAISGFQITNYKGPVALVGISAVGLIGGKLVMVLKGRGWQRTYNFKKDVTSGSGGYDQMQHQRKCSNRTDLAGLGLMYVSTFGLVAGVLWTSHRAFNAKGPMTLLAVSTVGSMVGIWWNGRGARRADDRACWAEEDEVYNDAERVAGRHRMLQAFCVISFALSAVGLAAGGALWAGSRVFNRLPRKSPKLLPVDGALTSLIPTTLPKKRPRRRG